jgi:hypothetical protein
MTSAKDPATVGSNLKVQFSVELQLHHYDCPNGADSRGIWPVLQPQERRIGTPYWQRRYSCCQCNTTIVASMCEAIEN